jgi:anaerobic ribonucleoside-triphosphate reductase activating protein
MTSPIPVNIFPDVAPRLNVAEVDVVEGAAGPGRRFVVWLQGCLKRCPGCANGPFLPLRPAVALGVEDLLSALETAMPLDGITLSGGEPTLQAAPLLPLLDGARLRGLSVFCYSGYTREELSAPSQAPELREFLARLDWLVDGEYQAALPRGGLYRPTSNQALHRLSPSKNHDGQPPAETECVLREGLWTITGTLPETVRRRMDEALRDLGLSVFSPTSRTSSPSNVFGLGKEER